jgi:hypothetical protein
MIDSVTLTILRQQWKQLIGKEEMRQVICLYLHIITILFVALSLLHGNMPVKTTLSWPI